MLEKFKNKNILDIRFFKIIINVFCRKIDNEIFEDVTESKIKKFFKKLNFFKILQKNFKKIKNTKSLLILLLEETRKAIPNKKTFDEAIICLCSNFTGLTFSEISKITLIDNFEFKIILYIFEEFIINSKKYLKINNPLFLQVFCEKYTKVDKINKKNKTDKLEKQKQIRIKTDKIKQIRLKIVKVLEKGTDSIRKLEEISFNIFLADEFFTLKQKISSIDNFIIFFNEKSKFYLFKYWFQLEKRGYDPVFEHNKSLELFEMHYNLNDSQYFMLNVQISRFFKELSEFECQITPSFRHPFLKSKIVQNNNTEEDFFNSEIISFKEKDDFFDPVQIDLAKFNFGTLDGFYENYIDVFSDSFAKDKHFLKMGLSGESKEKKLLNYLEEIGLLPELIKINIYGTSENKLKTHEMLNIEINSNKKKFLDYFVNKIQEKLSFKYKNKKIEKDYDFEIEDTISNKSDSGKLFLLKNEKQKNDGEITKMINNIDLTIEKKKEPIYYYYKRWVWMNFPLICLSKEKIDFSILMHYCYSGSSEYLSFEEDLNLYCKSLEIINKLKKKKLIVFNSNKKMQKSNAIENERIKKFEKKKIQSHSVIIHHKSKTKTDFFLEKKQKKLKNVKFIKNNFYSSKFNYRKYRKTGYNSLKLLSFNNKKENSKGLIKVLNRGQYKQNSVMKQYNKKLFNIFNNTNHPNKKPINFKRSIIIFEKDISNFTVKKVGMVFEKNLEMKKELNKIRDENQILKKKIDKLLTFVESTNGDLMKKKLNVEFTMKKKKAIIKYKSNIELMKNKFNLVRAEKKRYLEIIDVCLINQTENEDQIRNLNFYLKNLKKIIVLKKTDYLKKKKLILTKKHLSGILYEDYKKFKKIKQIHLKNFKNLFENERSVDLNIYNANRQIKNIINKEKEVKLQDKLKLNLWVEAKNKQKRKYSNTKQFKDLMILGKFYKDFNYFFDLEKNNDENLKKIKLPKIELSNKKYENFNPNWFKTKKFQKFLFFIDRRKKMMRTILEMQLKITEEKKKQDKILFLIDEEKLKYPSYLKTLGSILIKIKAKNQKEKKTVFKKSLENLKLIKNQKFEMLQKMKLGLQSIFSKMDINIDTFKKDELKYLLQNRDILAKKIILQFNKS